MVGRIVKVKKAEFVQAAVKWIEEAVNEILKERPQDR